MPCRSIPPYFVVSHGFALPVKDRLLSVSHGLALLNSSSANYRQSSNNARRQAREKGWPLKPDGSFTIEATISYLEFLEAKVIQGPKNGGIKHSTLLSYMTALHAYHKSINIDWSNVIHSFEVANKLHQISRNPNIPTQNSSQDDNILYSDLLEFCSKMNGSYIDDVVAATIATSLFWGLGRISELLHPLQYPPLMVECIKQSNDSSYRYQLERPKRGRIDYASQFISPVNTTGWTRPRSWIILLKQYRKRDRKALFTISNGVRPTSKWFLAKFNNTITKRYSKLGDCSFRSGGLTHMASLGFELSILRMLERWKSDAFEKYLRDHPQVLLAQLSAKANNRSIST